MICTHLPINTSDIHRQTSQSKGHASNYKVSFLNVYLWKGLMDLEMKSLSATLADQHFYQLKRLPTSAWTPLLLDLKEWHLVPQNDKHDHLYMILVLHVVVREFDALHTLSGDFFLFIATSKLVQCSIKAFHCSHLCCVGISNTTGVFARITMKSSTRQR